MSEPLQLSSFPLLCIFCGVFAAMTIALFPFQLHIAILGAPLMLTNSACAAMVIGRVWVSRERAPPAATRTWKISAICATVTTVVLAAVIDSSARGGNVLLHQVQYDSPAFGLAVITTASAILSFVLIRAGLWLGVRQGRAFAS